MNMERHIYHSNTKL